MLVGSTNYLEFRDVKNWLHEYVKLTYTETPLKAVSLLKETDYLPDVIVFAQSWPGQYSTKSVEHIGRVAPLARIVTLLGSWCEGETRTGKPIPGCFRTYWHQWPHRGASELVKLADNKCPSWGLQLTASENEYVEHLSLKTSTGRKGLIALATETIDSAEMLSEVLVSVGYATAILTPQNENLLQGISVVIFDGTGVDQTDAHEMKRLKKLYPTAHLIVLANFPRREFRDLALDSGAACLISKPFLLDDLFWQLDNLTQEEGQALTQPAA